MGETLCCSLISTSHLWPAPGQMHTPGCVFLPWSHLAGWDRQCPGHRALCGIPIPVGQHTALGLLEGKEPFLLYQAQYKSTHPLSAVALRKPWSCSHLGDVGGGGSGERFRSGAEYAGEHLLPSRATRDLWDTSRSGGHQGDPQPSSQRARTFPLGCTHSAKHRRESMAREKATELCFQLHQGLGGTRRGFHRYPRPTAAGKDRGSHSCFGSSPPTLRATLAQSSQAASVSVHATEHAKGWEGRLARMHWYPSPSASSALPAAQRDEPGCLARLDSIKMRGGSKKSLSRGRAVLGRMVGGHHLHSGDFVGGLG